MIGLIRDIASDGDVDNKSLSRSVGSGMRWVGLLFGLARLEIRLSFSGAKGGWVVAGTP
jgi:hypothetical protein